MATRSSTAPSTAQQLVFALALGVLAVTLLAGCTGRQSQESGPRRGAGAKPRAARSAPGTSTVPAPTLPTFSDSWFVVDKDGTGKAVARFSAAAPDPERRRWHRVVRLIVDGSKVDGVWVDSLTFEGRLSDDTIITAKYEAAPGSQKYRKVSRRLSDILSADPSWRGFADNTRVSVTFKRAGNSPVNIVTMTALDPIPAWVRLPDASPVYRYGQAPDPIVANAMARLDGERASIVGYVIDFVSKDSAQGRSIVELVVGKDGKTYRIPGWGRPRAAFGHVPQPRAQPEPAGEAAQRNRAVAAGSRAVSGILPETSGEVFAYVVRVERTDRSVVDVVVESDGRLDSREVRLQPWRAR